MIIIYFNSEISLVMYILCILYDKSLNFFIFRRKLSYGYAFIAWNLFGLVGYMIYTGRIKKTESDLSQGMLSCHFVNIYI